MDKGLQKLINDFNNNSSLESQNRIEEYYIKNFQNRENIQKDLLQFIEQDKTEKKVDWSVFFNFDTQFWLKIILAEQKFKASESLSLCIEMKGKDVFLEMAADLGAIFYNRAKEDLTEDVANDIEKIWLQSFSNFPIFSEEWEKNKTRRIESEKEYTATISEYVEPETIQILEIKVPSDIKESGSLKIDNNQSTFIQESPEYIKFMNDRIDFFNNFHLHSYMDIPECHSVEMAIDGSDYIFTLKMNKEVNLEKIKKALLGQLSDGLGSNLSQKPLLIEDKIYYFDFDNEKSSDIYQVEILSKKFKL